MVLCAVRCGALRLCYIVLCDAFVFFRLRFADACFLVAVVCFSCVVLRVGVGLFVLGVLFWCLAFVRFCCFFAFAMFFV